MSDQQPTLSKQDRERLDELYRTIQERNRTYAGYPCSALFDYSPLFRFLSYPMNNVGDPYVTSNFGLNTHVFEREVLEIFQQLTHTTKDASWGYVTNGGTEGNMYGIFLARELLPDGIVYYSEDTHYSVNKILRCLKVRNATIKGNPDGSIDLEDLYETISIHRDIPPIICANIGTTMKGAIDDLCGIQKILRDLAIERFYIHADAALSGMILPFVDHPQPWDFLSDISSISISGHKMIGSPIPCGVAIAKKTNVERIARRVEYVGTLDTTLSGSRNAITPLFLWYAFRTVGIKGFQKRTQQCLEMAEYAVEHLKRIGRRAWRHKNSITVVFDRPLRQFVYRWQLAAADDLAHIVTMPHIGTQLIDQIVADIADDISEPVRESLNP